MDNFVQIGLVNTYETKQYQLTVIGITNSITIYQQHNTNLYKIVDYTVTIVHCYLITVIQSNNKLANINNCKNNCVNLIFKCHLYHRKIFRS